MIEEINSVEEAEIETSEQSLENKDNDVKKAFKQFQSIKQNGNKTTNKFGTNYKKARKKKNKVQRKSRKNN